MHDRTLAILSDPPAKAAKGIQRRSELRRSAIEEAAVAVIGRDGISRLTHRSVAREAGVPLASTTYHYATGKDIITAASDQLLNTYVRNFDRLARRLPALAENNFDQIVLHALMGGVEKHRTATLAWCEIMLNCARDAAGQAMARQWFDTVLEIWTEIARRTGLSDPELKAQSTIDIVTGLSLAFLPLGSTARDVAAVLRPGGSDPLVLAPAEREAALPGTQARVQKRGDISRDKIVDAAARIVSEQGAGAVTMRKVAALAGVSAAAPSYYFPTADDLLNATLAQLFDTAKGRYRDALSVGAARPTDVGQLADLTTAVFLREATEFRSVALASYPLRVEAARQPILRSSVWYSIQNQNVAWMRQLNSAGINAGPRAGLIAQSLFLGKLVRILATRTSTVELAAVRREFLDELNAFQQETHWTRNWYV